VKRAAVANGSPMRKEYPMMSSPATMRTGAIKRANILAGLCLVRYLLIVLNLPPVNDAFVLFNDEFIPQT
jgi:hypothetical protein